MILALASRYFSLECGRDVAAQALDEFSYFPLEGGAVAGGKRQAGGSRLILEVVDVAPIGGGRCRLGQPFDHLPDERAFSRANRSRDEDIEARAFHLQAEFQRFDCPLLADRFIERLDLTRVLESQRTRIDDRCQKTRGNPKFLCHGSSPAVV